MALEQGGIPTIAVHTQAFARLVKSVTKVSGMPTARQAFVPHPVVGVSSAVLRGYIEGNDPIQKRPFVQVMIEGLTGPFTDEDLHGVSFERSTPRLLEPDTEDNLQRQFMENNWTDYMPVILPTEERVERMLKGTSHAADKVVGRLRPTNFREFWEFTVEKVAVNAVMAGASPEYFPVILALASSGITARSSSTTSFATMAIINGPIRNEIGMNAGIGAMGPWNHANTSIGRAYGLLSQNLQGGSVPNETYMGSMGNSLSYSAVYPEHEERSPWEPLHVQYGARPEENTAAIFFGGWYTLSGFGPRDTWEDTFSRSLAACDAFSEPVIFLDPVAAQGFVDKGFDSKRKLIDWFAEHSRLKARDYWDNQSVQTIYRPYAVSGIEPFAGRLKADPDELIQIFGADKINIVVLGGGTQGAWKMVSGMRRSELISIDAWR